MQLICHTDALKEGEARGFETAGRALLVVRRQHQFYVYENRCPHRGIRLEWQADQFLDYEKQFIQCATHGALFRIEDGECIAGPCPGERLTPCQFLQQDNSLYLIP
ncbi:MAG: Rieske (2Fe-2S) protein [Nitrincola lacisaponensis]|uniref:Rieske (2Fe-2S) protein n=1 Tax=Nitrincola lacisaponensis TaxID=267850 RepID=UPI003919BBCA